MFRFVVSLIGFAFVAALIYAAFTPRDKVVPDPVHALHQHPHKVKWAQSGLLGSFDRGQLQRGFQVYKEVCSACHALENVAFHDLSGIGFSEGEIKALAKNWPVQVPAINGDTGEATTRPAIPSDKIPSPYPNEIAAVAANRAVPPDLSLIVKARHGGADYVHSLLTGYAKPPKGWVVPEGLHYNPYFSSLNIAMAPPLTGEGQVTYSDGTKASVDQMSMDVSAFLEWASEPRFEDRRRIGLGVMIFLVIFTALAFASYRRVWSTSRKDQE